MAVLTWDQTGQRFYETGVDHGVLYTPDAQGNYPTGVAWNGLVSVTEAPAGAESNKQYADNIVYVDLRSAEEFGATLEAFTYPDEWNQHDGNIVQDGIVIGQQPRKLFGMSYRSRLGNDVDGDDHSEKLHLMYGLTASPSERQYQTVNDSPELITFSWELSGVPVQVTGMRPTCLLVVPKKDVDATAYAQLEDLLYGTEGTDPQLPLPDTVLALFAGTATAVTATEPAFDQGTNTITIPSITGVTYYDDTAGGVEAPAGAYVITEDTFIRAAADPGYVLNPGDTDWFYTFV